MKIALYDIDYTLIPFDSFFKFVVMLLKNRPSNYMKLPSLIFDGVLTSLKIKSLTEYKTKWLSLTEYLDDVELDLLSKKFIETKILPYIKEDVAQNIEKYRQNGYKIIFATASFEFYLKYLAIYFNADLFFGTEMEVIDGKRVIKGKNCKGIEKINRIKNEISSTEIDKHSSIGFSDSMSDYPYINLVDTFNIVHKKKWQVIKTYHKEVE